jgi:hypothetical protein
MFMTHSHQWQHLDIILLDPHAPQYKCVIFDSDKPSNKILNDDMYEKIQKNLPSCLLTYIYAYIMQQHDTSLCGLYVIVYVLDIAFKSNQNLQAILSH